MPERPLCHGELSARLPQPRVWAATMSNALSHWPLRGGCMEPTWSPTSSRWRILRRHFGSCVSVSMTRSKLSSCHRVCVRAHRVQDTDNQQYGLLAYTNTHRLSPLQCVENIAPGQLAWRHRTAGTHAGRTGHACGKGTLRDCVEAAVPWRTKAGDVRHRLMLYARQQACTAHH